MKKIALPFLFLALLLSACSDYNKLLKSTDYDYKYEAESYLILSAAL